MRHVFHAFPWIHPEESFDIQSIYTKYGSLKCIKKGEILKNSYEFNQLFFLEKGLCAYYINFYMNKPRVLSLIVPGRVMGDVTCITKDRVNVTVRALRDSEVLSISPQRLLSVIGSDQKHMLLLMQSIIRKQESHLEGMMANFLLPPEMRLKAFIKVMLLIFDADFVSEWRAVPLVLSHEEYDEIINVSRVSISRIFARWRKKGVMRNQGRILLIRSEFLSDVYDWLDFFRKE